MHQKFAFTQKIPVLTQAPHLLRVLLVLPMLGWDRSGIPDDRHRIVFTGQPAMNDSDLFSLQPDGRGLRRITQSSGVDSEPSRSPDGRTVVYTCGQAEQLDLCRSDLNGGNTVQLTQDTAIDLFPALSPDGQQVVWMSEQQGNYDLYLLDAQNRRQRITYNTTKEVSPSWSPDGRQLTFVSNRHGNYEIYRMNRDGSQVVRLTHNPLADSSPAWSPDGQWIIYLSEQSQPYPTKVLYRMRPDGSQKIPLTPPEWHLRAPAWSADSQWIVFGAKYVDPTSGQMLQNSLWLLPAQGGTPIPYPATQELNPSGASW